MLNFLRELFGWQENVPDFILFLGHFHPLILHFPIALLIFSWALQVYSTIKKEDELYPRLAKISWVWGTYSALIAFIFGLFLGINQDYQGETIDLHSWTGLITSIGALATLVLYKKTRLIYISSSTLTILALSFCAHFGAQITHGKDYLFTYAPDFIRETQDLPKKGEIAVNDRTRVYQDIVAPILVKYCTDCHGETKEKGDVRLDSPYHINNSGMLLAGDPVSSTIYDLMVTNDPEDMMPPEDKKQPSEAEKEIIRLWILSGASYEGTLGENAEKDAIDKELKK